MKLLIPSLSLLTILCLLLTVNPASAGEILYENGVVDDDTDAWIISHGYVVSDTFTLAGNSTASGFDIVVWEYPGDEVLSVGWSITSQVNGGTLYGTGAAPVTSTFIYVNAFGYDIYEISATVPGVSLNSGTYWLNLTNAFVSSGDPVYWDENSGKECHSLGCPSLAYDSAVGTIPSETFCLAGAVGAATPELGSIALLGSGIFGVAGTLRRKRADA